MVPQQYERTRHIPGSVSWRALAWLALCDAIIVLGRIGIALTAAWR